MKLTTILFVTAATLSMWGCSPSGDDTNAQQETAVSGTVEVLVDDQIYQLIVQAKTFYDADNPDAHVQLKKVDANRGVGELLRHEAAALIVARDWSGEELDAITAERGTEGYPRTLLATDALVFYTSKSFPYDTMHADHLRQWLSTGKFPGKSYPKLKTSPTAVVPGSYSSEYGNLVTVVLNGKTPASTSLSSLGTSDAVLAKIRTSPTFIGVGLLSQLVADSSVKLLRLSWTDSTGSYEHPRPVHQGYVVQELYPFPVPIWFVLRDKVHNYNLASGFMQYLARDGKAQRSFLEAGIVPAFAKIELNILE